MNVDGCVRCCTQPSSQGGCCTCSCTGTTTSGPLCCRDPVTNQPTCCVWGADAEMSTCCPFCVPLEARNCICCFDCSRNDAETGCCPCGKTGQEVPCVLHCLLCRKRSDDGCTLCPRRCERLCERCADCNVTKRCASCCSRCRDEMVAVSICCDHCSRNRRAACIVMIHTLRERLQFARIWLRDWFWYCCHSIRDTIRKFYISSLSTCNHCLSRLSSPPRGATCLPCKHCLSFCCKCMQLNCCLAIENSETLTPVLTCKLPICCKVYPTNAGTVGSGASSTSQANEHLTPILTKRRSHPSTHRVHFEKPLETKLGQSSQSQTHLDQQGSESDASGKQSNSDSNWVDTGVQSNIMTDDQPTTRPNKSGGRRPARSKMAEERQARNSVEPSPSIGRHPKQRSSIMTVENSDQESSGSSISLELTQVMSLSDQTSSEENACNSGSGWLLMMEVFLFKFPVISCHH